VKQCGSETCPCACHDTWCECATAKAEQRVLKAAEISTRLWDEECFGPAQVRADKALSAAVRKLRKARDK
jgi:hypothetical protein